MTEYHLIVKRLTDIFHFDIAEGDVPPDRLLTIDEATWLPELGGQFSTKMLRTAIEAGRLPARKMGKRILLTRSGIDEWRDNCRVKPSPSASTSSQSAGSRTGRSSSHRSGASRTETDASALDAALMIVRALKSPSANTLLDSMPKQSRSQTNRRQTPASRM
jgi:hypothetical protein